MISELFFDVILSLSLLHEIKDEKSKFNYLFISRARNTGKKSIYRVAQKKCTHSLLINIFGINLNEISISG